MKGKITKIQIFRGFLFVIILCFHCGAPFAALGWGGVETFFVISSFFLTRKILLTGDETIKSRISHRIKRLYPPYILVLVVAVIHSFVILRRLPTDLPILLLSLQNFMWIKTGYISPMQPLTAHTWTISIEVWMGIIWLILISKFRSRKKIKMVCFISIIVAVVVRTLSILSGLGALFITLFPLSHADAFGLGGH